MPIIAHIVVRGRHCLRRRGLAVVLLAGVAAAPAVGHANAPFRRLSHTGAWSVLTTASDDSGKPLCVLTDDSSNWFFAYKYQAGANHLDGQMWKRSWSIPAGTPIDLTITIDGDVAWTVRAVGKRDQIQWILPPAQIPRFEQAFRMGHRMTVTFGTGNEPPWSLSLNGSDAAALSMGRCMHGIGAGQGVGGPTQPFSSPPSAPSQPYPPRSAPPPPFPPHASTPDVAPNGVQI